MFDKYEASSEPLSPYDSTGGIMFERFTDRSREVVTLAQAEAQALDHDYIGTEHLLLALMNLEGSVSREVLTSRGYEVDKLRERLDRGRATTTYRSIPFTPRAKKVLELSLREALQYGHRAIDDHHLLLGILRMDESTALTMLIPDSKTRVVTGLRQAILESPRVTASHEAAGPDEAADATPSSSKEALMTQIASRLEGKSEADLQSLLDSLA